MELLRELVPGGNVQLEGERVWLWPKGQREKGKPPLELRLIKVPRGKETWYLVTSLLDPAQLTESQASKLYSRRWGVECCFRTLKRTFERGNVRSYTPECAGAELDWSLLSLWLVSLMTKRELMVAQIDPEQYSPAGVAVLHGGLEFGNVEPFLARRLLSQFAADQAAGKCRFRPNQRAMSPSIPRT